MKKVIGTMSLSMRKVEHLLTCNLIINDYSTLGVHYWDLQALVHEQETRNLTLHDTQPSAVLNFEFLVRERVLVNPDNARTKSAENVLIFNLSKRLKHVHFEKHLPRFIVENVYNTQIRRVKVYYLKVP